jgi:tetratricopeptide (TPR) repeat protein
VDRSGEWRLGAGAVSSGLSGKARDVVQARDISGGVHFHGPLHTEAAIPRQLPAEVPGFVGRGRELERLEALLDGVGGRGGAGPRLAVVAGTAGVGKTSLAVRFAHRVRGRFPDGQLFVNLRGYDSGPPLTPASALERFLRALGAQGPEIPVDWEERAEAYRTLLADRRVLVVLDNAATARQIRPLLPGGSGCFVLVTSRSRLSGITARDGAERLTLGLLARDDAIALIEKVLHGCRAGDHPELVEELAELCVRLPLALRIAAERAASRPLMPLGRLVDELRSHATMWEALSADDEADAVRTVFAWSYRALPPDAARAFRLFGLHPGPEFGEGAAAAALAAALGTARTVLDALTGAHLLEQVGPERYRYHDLLRAYAADLVASESELAERSEAVARLTDWYLHSADAADRSAYASAASALPEPPAPGVKPARFTDQPEASAWYGIERANLLALLGKLTESGDSRKALLLASTLERMQDAYAAADDRLETARLGLIAARDAGDRCGEGLMLRSLAHVYRGVGRLDDALELHQQASNLFAASGEATGAIGAANGIALIHYERRELTRAVELFQHAADLATACGESYWKAVALSNIAQTTLDQGNLSESVIYAERALAAFDEVDSHSAERLESLLCLARALRESGRRDQAAACLNEADHAVAAGTRHLGVEVLLKLERAHLAFDRGHLETALCLYQQTANSAKALYTRSLEAAALTGIGLAMTTLGRPVEAVDSHARAVALYRTRCDPCRLAFALAREADSLDAIGQHDQAREHRLEAKALIADFTDRSADALRDLITRALADNP